MAYDISIIIVSYKCLESLKECLDSCLAQRNISFEIIVLDNYSQDGTEEYLKNLNVKSLFPGKNIGFGKGVNLAAREASGDLLFILNPDTVLPPDTLSDLNRFALLLPDWGLISPLLIYDNGQTQLSARKFPRRRDFFMGRGSPLYKLGITNEKKAGYISSTGDTPVNVEAVSATALLIKSELFRKLGGFDERFFMYLEDIDLCKRVSRLGLQTWILPDIRITHKWRKSSGKIPLKAAYYHHLSVFKYFCKYSPGQWTQNFILCLALIAGFMVTSIMQLFGRKGEK